MGFASVPILASATGTAVTTIVWLLVAVALVAVLTHFVRVPYTIALVVAGLALGVIGGPFTVPLTESLILDVFIPALLFEAAYNLSWPRLRAEIRPITALAIPGVIVGTFIVGAIVHLAGLRWPVALLFGALIAATDPVSVLATFRRIGATRRLAIIVEGESLFNDGTALVVFKLVLTVVIAGGVTASMTILAFIASIAGGIAIGLAVGYLGALLLRQIDDYLVEVTVTLLMAYGTFIACEHAHLTVRGNEIGASPVIAVVVLALVTGNYAARSSMSARTRLSMYDTWELIGYFANSLIFLLIGLQIHTASVTRAEIPLVFWAIVGILVSRAIVVYGVGVYTNWRNAPVFRLPLRFQHVILWGGLRGAISLAAALSIPGGAVPERPTIIVMTFGIVVFTLLVQGLTIRPLVARLGLSGTDRSAHLLAFERLQGQLVATQAARRALKDLADTGEIAPNVFAQVSHAYEERGDRLREALEGLNVSASEIRAEQVIVARRKALQAEKDALLSLRKRGTLTGSVYRALNADIDRRLLQIEEEPAVESEAEQFESNPDPHSETAQ
ncbi:MAG: Na+/H+ antiporter [Thermomicrobiales bacterium]